MKKATVIIIIAAIASLCVYFVLKSPGKANDNTTKDQPLVISKNSDTVNRAFSHLLIQYYALTNALVNWDTSKANASTQLFATATTKIPFNQLKGDSTLILTARSFAEMLFAESMGIIGETTIEGKRRSFYTLSDNLYNLLRTVQYDQAVLYHFNCPSAFGENEEGYWLSNTKTVENPYYGNKHPQYKDAKLHDGIIEDSIDFRKK